MNCSAPTGFIKNFTKANSPIKPDVSPLMFPYFAADKIMPAAIFLFDGLISLEIFEIVLNIFYSFFIFYCQISDICVILRKSKDSAFDFSA